MNKEPPRLYEFGPFRMDVSEQLLTRDAAIVPLTRKAFQTLLVLVENNGHVVAKDVLMKRVWPDTCVEEANLTQHVFTLRKLLGDYNDGCQYIETLPRRGYRFVASVREVSDKDADAGAALHASADGNGDGHAHRINGERAVGVLPFRIIGPKTGTEYLGLALADALITQLGNLRQLTVRPTSAVCKYVGGVQDLVNVGRELRVGSVLEGSIQRFGRRLRVTVQLVSLPQGSTLWAEKFDEKFTDMLTVEDSISEQVMKALLLKQADDERHFSIKRYTASPEAYKFYLKGRFFWNKSRSARTRQQIAGALRQSVECLAQAIKIAPDYALAYASLSDSYILLSTSNVLPPNECLSLAREAALQALKIDGTLAEAHCSLATVQTLYEWNWPVAEQEYRRALELNPNYATAHHWYAKYLSKMGRHQEAMKEIRHAQELDPLSLVISTEIARLSFFARQYEQAIEQCAEALDMNPHLISAHALLGFVYTATGAYEEALKHMRKIIHACGDDIEIMALVGYIYGRAGRFKDARRLLNELQSSSQTFISPFYKAVIYTGLDDKRLAVNWLEKAYAEHSYLLTFLNIPIFDSLRAYPKFVNLIKRVGL